MDIRLNGDKYVTEADTLRKLLDELQLKWSIDLDHVVVLVNDIIVKSDFFEEKSIKEEDSIEVLSFVSGG